MSHFHIVHPTGLLNRECTWGGGGEGVQMSHFHIVHPTGLLNRCMHNMPIFERNSMKFGEHMLE